MTRFAFLVLVGLLFRAAPSASADATDPLSESYKLQTANVTAEATPNTYFLRLRLAYLSSLVGDYAGAADAYRTAAKLAPAAIEPLLGQQLALVTLGRWEDAETVAKQILAIDPTSYLARSRLAWTRYKRKDFRGAAELYAALLALYPGDIDMRLGLGWSMLGLGRRDDATAAFHEVLTMVPKQSGATEGVAAAAKLTAP